MKCKYEKFPFIPQKACTNIRIKIPFHFLWSNLSYKQNLKQTNRKQSKNHFYANSIVSHSFVSWLIRIPIPKAINIQKQPNQRWLQTSEIIIKEWIKSRFIGNWGGGYRWTFVYFYSSIKQINWLVSQNNTLNININ